ncbi:MAG TPA: biotin-dependent carboxyltransferase family protein [Flavobacteriaceae bacterium]|nr:biotin-dependent carboxyltransferase family protein [Flavobacteriaceae bacterium]
MIEVLKSGFATSIQDLGRVGFAKFGVPKNGAMDQYSANFANLLVGNSLDAAVMEITLTGPKLHFHSKTLIAVVSLGTELFLNGEKQALNEACLVENGSVLELQKITLGNFAYLAVYGGFQTEFVLGSRSMYDGITSKSRLKKGSVLEIPAYSSTIKTLYASTRFDMERYSTNKVEVFTGPEFHLLSEKTKQLLLENKFTLSSDSNRMAYLLEEQLENELKPILTGPVLPGTIQLTPSGKLIVLMRDCQTTGGYPRVLQVSEKSLGVLAQKRTRETVLFSLQK